MRRGKEAEKDAAKFLVRRGYKILSYQDRAKYYLKINDKEIEKVDIIADFLVEKNNQIYVVEVKTGDTAVSLKNAATRRQLLEYYNVYAPYRILLLNMDNGTINSIEFSFEAKKDSQIIAIFYLILGFLIGGVFVYFLTKVK